jgi:hypothetical protein
MVVIGVRVRQVKKALSLFPFGLFNGLPVLALLLGIVALTYFLP